MYMKACRTKKYIEEQFGSLQYLTTNSRPDIAVGTSILADESVSNSRGLDRSEENIQISEPHQRYEAEVG